MACWAARPKLKHKSDLNGCPPRDRPVPPACFWKSWPAVKRWTSATLLCSTWSRWRETQQIPAKSTRFYLPWLNGALNFTLFAFRFSTWLFCSQKKQIFLIFHFSDIFETALKKVENICTLTSKNCTQSCQQNAVISFVTTASWLQSKRHKEEKRKKILPDWIHFLPFEWLSGQRR